MYVVFNKQSTDHHIKQSIDNCPFSSANTKVCQRTLKCYIHFMAKKEVIVCFYCVLPIYLFSCKTNNTKLNLKTPQIAFVCFVLVLFAWPYAHYTYNIQSRASWTLQVILPIFPCYFPPNSPARWHLWMASILESWIEDTNWIYYCSLGAAALRRRACLRVAKMFLKTIFLANCSPNTASVKCMTSWSSACGRYPAVWLALPSVANEDFTYVSGDGANTLGLRILVMLVATKPGCTLCITMPCLPYSVCRSSLNLFTNA